METYFHLVYIGTSLSVLRSWLQIRPSEGELTPGELYRAARARLNPNKSALSDERDRCKVGLEGEEGGGGGGGALRLGAVRSQPTPSASTARSTANRRPALSIDADMCEGGLF